MRSDVARDLSESAEAFVLLVWPIIKNWVGGGELLPVEAVTASGMAKDLDVLAGIDAWHIVQAEGKMRGIASRVQPMPGFRTFTIRYRRSSGASTEWEKRLRAMDKPGEGWLLPHLWCHAYRTSEPVSQSRLTGAALIRTRDLFEYARSRLPDAMTRYNAGESRRGDLYIERTRSDGNLFIVVRWDALKVAGISPFRIYDGNSVVTRAVDDVHTMAAGPHRQLRLFD